MKLAMKKRRAKQIISEKAIDRYIQAAISRSKKIPDATMAQEYLLRIRDTLNQRGVSTFKVMHLFDEIAERKKIRHNVSGD